MYKNNIYKKMLLYFNINVKYNVNNNILSDKILNSLELVIKSINFNMPLSERFNVSDAS